MMQEKSMRAMFIIATAGYASDVIEVARSAGVTGATILNARGEGMRHELFMGITIDSEKELILCAVDADTADRAMAAIKEKAGIKTPAHSVAFTMPIDKTVGLHLPGTQTGD